MSQKRTVFLIGPGFIGLEIIDELLRDGSYDITTLVRRPEAEADLHKLGVKTVRGTLADGDIISRHAAAADIVIHCATADDLPSVQSVLKGIAKGAGEGGRAPIYIHTSGCSAFADQSDGEYASETVYEDDKPETVDSIADDAHHRQIDLAILQARRELGDRARIAIVLPPLIYGRGKQDKLSIQIPILTRFALKHGYAGHVGKGRSVWGQVHVSDLARGYLAVLRHLETSAAGGAGTAESPYFFAENGDEQSWGRVAAEIGKALHGAGRIEDAAPREIPAAEYGDLFADFTLPVLAQNARNRANRLRALGWKPVEKSTFASLVEDELPIILAEKGEFHGYGKPVAS